MRFLGLFLCDTVPDEKTIWEFRDTLVQVNIIDTMFYRFTQQLEEKERKHHRRDICGSAAAVEQPGGKQGDKGRESTGGMGAGRELEQAAAKGYGCAVGEEE